MHKAVSQNETCWIYELCRLSPQGMNIDMDINCFYLISDFQFDYVIWKSFCILGFLYLNQFLFNH